MHSTHPAQDRIPTFIFVLPWSPVHLGGVNQVVINLAREMTRQRTFEPIILVTDWDAVVPVWEVIHGLKTVRWRIRPFPTRRGIKEKAAYFMWEYRFRGVFSSFCRKHNVAAINPHYPEPTSITLSRAIESFDHDIPLILSYHGTDVANLKRASAEEVRHYSRMFSFANGIVVCSSDLGRRLSDVFGKEIRPSVIHNGIDATAFGSFVEKHITVAEPFILNVGKFVENKGQATLIEAFALIADDYVNLNLVLLGATGEALPALQVLATKKGLAGRIYFYPDTAHVDVANFFRKATIFVLPSREEAFGIVLLEAGVFALPVVASSVGGIPELLTEAETGHLIAADSPSELAQSLCLMLENPVAAREMGERLKIHVEKNFTWTSAHDKYVALVRTN